MLCLPAHWENKNKTKHKDRYQVLLYEAVFDIHVRLRLWLKYIMLSAHVLHMYIHYLKPEHTKKETIEQNGAKYKHCVCYSWKTLFFHLCSFSLQAVLSGLQMKHFQGINRTKLTTKRIILILLSSFS